MAGSPERQQPGHPPCPSCTACSTRACIRPSSTISHALHLAADVFCTENPRVELCGAALMDQDAFHCGAVFYVRTGMLSPTKAARQALLVWGYVKVHILHDKIWC